MFKVFLSVCLCMCTQTVNGSSVSMSIIISKNNLQSTDEIAAMVIRYAFILLYTFKLSQNATIRISFSFYASCLLFSSLILLYDMLAIRPMPSKYRQTATNREKFTEKNKNWICAIEEKKGAKYGL